MMAEAQGDDDEIFVYMGGRQQVPHGVRRARIHKSVKIVPVRAFLSRTQLYYVEFHDGVEIIEEWAFHGCISLRGAIRLLGVKIIKASAFCNCNSLTDVEFGNKLESIESHAFNACSSLRKIRIPSVRTVGKWVFAWCDELSDVEFGEGLIARQEKTFLGCLKLKRVALPMKSGLIGQLVFSACEQLTTVDLVGGIHQTVASLHMESWRSEMTGEINRINQTLPTITVGKTETIQRWMESTIRQLDHYKSEHHKILKEATVLLELALWKANLGDNEGGQLKREGVRTTRGSRKRARKEICVTSGASIVIKNVLPYLQLLD